MIPYHLIRVDHPGHESVVAAAIARMGYDAVVPLEAIAYRPTRVKPVWRVQLRPAIPKSLFAAVPASAHGDLQRVRCFAAILRDAASAPVEIPAIQVKRFLDYLQDWNDKEAGRINAGNRGPKTRRAWVKLEAGSCADLMARLFGGAVDMAA